MRDPAELFPGTFDLLILESVLLGKPHGYGMPLWVRQISGGALPIQQGAIYLALYRLEHQGLIERKRGTSESSRRAKYDRLTRAGRRRLGKETASCNRLVEAIARSPAATPQGLR